jgi:hypothetical protein
LLSDSTTLSSDSISPDFQTLLHNTIGHDGVIESNTPDIYHKIEESSTSEIGSSEISVFDASIKKFSPYQIGSSKINIGEIGSGEISSFQESIFEHGSNQISPTQVSPTQVGFSQPSTDQISGIQVSPTQVSLNQVSPTQTGLSEINFSQIGSTQVSPTQISSAQTSSTQVSPTQIGTDQLSISQVNSSQLSINQLDTTEIDTSKIPLTSSVPSEQFLSSHHNSTSYNFDNSASLLATGTEIINPKSVEYNPKTNTATLYFDGFEASEYELIVDDNLTNPDGITLKEPYQVDFTAVSDFSELVDLKFTNTRSDRQNQTISFDISLTNTIDYDLSLPLNLVLRSGNNSETAQPSKYTSISDTGAYFIDLSDSLPDGILKSGESVTEETVTIYNPDDLRFEFEPGIYTLPTNNQAPVFSSEPITVATAGESYVYNVAASDPDGSVVGYLLYDAPEGMSVNQSGQITWSPTEGSPSEAKVSLHVLGNLSGSPITDRLVSIPFSLQ